VFSPPTLVAGTENGVLLRRAVAFLLDVGLWVVVSSVPVIADLLVYTRATATSSVTIAYGGIVFLCYLAVTQGAAGQTISKYLVGIGVADAEGGPCSWGQAAGRSLVLLVDIALLGLPAIVSVLRSDRRQRVGDRVAGAVVVRATR
jgi:uncharacterized RDD family membrane protein YckC